MWVESGQRSGRHGRLHPGIAPPIDGPITSCEPLPPPKVLLGFYADNAARQRLGPRGVRLAWAIQPGGVASHWSRRRLMR